MGRYVEDRRCIFGEVDWQGWPVWCSQCPYRESCGDEPRVRSARWERTEDQQEED